jgi:cyclohexyl-isocyanide hydratase
MSEPNPRDQNLSIGILIFPQATQLDFGGPYEVFNRMKNVEVHLVWKTIEPVPCGKNFTVLPSVDFAACPPLDVLCVPGGMGQHALMQDDAVLDWVARQGETARYVTGVCTGSLILGAAGLLRGYRAATHWASMELLGLTGAIPTAERVVVDRNRITGGGVTAGIDFALTLAAIIDGEAAAKKIQLWLEYDPAPPFDAGHPRRLPKEFVDDALAVIGDFGPKRRQAVIDAVTRRAIG